jgi:hypothetical protein
MQKLFRWANFTANILIICAVLLMTGIAVKKYFLTAPSPSEPARPAIGTKMTLSGINWAEQPKTLVLALQTHCRFCNESAPFYKRLIENAESRHVKLIAIFPTKVEESLAHLHSLGLNGLEARQSPLSSLPVNGTPTLIMTNNSGEVINVWRGKLSRSQEDEVISKL